MTSEFCLFPNGLSYYLLNFLTVLFLPSYFCLMTQYGNHCITNKTFSNLFLTLSFFNFFYFFCCILLGLSYCLTLDCFLKQLIWRLFLSFGRFSESFFFLFFMRGMKTSHNCCFQMHHFRLEKLCIMLLLKE